MTKKFINRKNIYKMFFSVITKNLNWETLTTNLVIFKSCTGVKDEKIKY